MELTADVKTFSRQLHYFHQFAVGRLTAQRHAVLFEYFAISVVEFVAVAMAFGYLRTTVHGIYGGAGFENAVVRPETHCPSHVFDVFLVVHEIDYLAVRLRLELAGGGSFKTAYVAGEFYRHHLHTETYSKARNIVFARITAGLYHSFRSTVAKTARNDYAADAGEYHGSRLRRNGFAVHPSYVDARAAGISSRIQRLRHRQIGVVQRDVFSYQRYIHGFFRRLDRF